MPDAAPARAGTRRLFLHCVGSALPALERQAERALVLARATTWSASRARSSPSTSASSRRSGWAPRRPTWSWCRRGDGVAGTLAERLLRTGGMVERLAGRLGPADVTIHPYAGRAEVFALAQALERVAGRSVGVHAGPPDSTALAESKHLMRERAIALGIPVAPGEVATLPHTGAGAATSSRCARRSSGSSAGPDGCVVRGDVGCGAARRGTSSSPAGTTPTRCSGGWRSAPTTGCSWSRCWWTRPSARPSTLLIEPTSGAWRLEGVSDRRLGRGLAPVGEPLSRPRPRARRRDEVLGGPASAGLAARWTASPGGSGSTSSSIAPAAAEPAVLPRRRRAPRRRRRPTRWRWEAAAGAGASSPGRCRSGAASFGRLREILGSLLYDPDRGAGVVPYATGWLEQGKCPIVAFGGTGTRPPSSSGRRRRPWRRRPLTSPPDGP